MPLFGDSRCSHRHGAPWDRERPRSVRERLELLVSVLGELEYLRHRQRLLVLSALTEEEEAWSEEQLLVLRRQLSCLRREAGVISDLHQLDLQVSELRLEPEMSHDQLETDSRPSSGFYELSDGASGSLSNSSHSVFSESFCSTPEAEGRLLSSEELASCLECGVLLGGLRDDPGSSGAVRRSLSAPHQASLEATAWGPSDSPAKHLCSLFPRNFSEVHCHQSPSHAAVAQGSGHAGQCRDDSSGECLKTETTPIPSPVSGPLRPQSSQTHSRKHLERYIFGLLQRRVQPIRASRPRTSITTDPLKSVVRQPSFCLRQASSPGPGVGTLKGSEVKSLLPDGETSANAATSSPQRQGSVDRKDQDKGSRGDSNSRASHNGSVASRVKNPNTKRVLGRKCKGSPSLPGALVSTPPSDITAQRSPTCNSSDKQTGQPCCPNDQEYPLKPILAGRTQTSKKSCKPLQSGRNDSEPINCSSDSAHNLDKGVRVESPAGNRAKAHNEKHRKGNSRNVKISKARITSRTNLTLSSEKRGDAFYHKAGSDGFLQVEDGGPNHVKVSSRGTLSGRKNIPASTLIAGVPEKHARPTQTAARSGVLKQHQHGSHRSHQHHGRHEQLIVVAKPKYKRNDYRPLQRAVMEVQRDGANKHAQRRQRRKLLRNPAVKPKPTTGGQHSGPYCTVAGSDSEYSAECVSLFHSTVADTSEDERSNYTTNCFGDSESSEEENTSTASDVEEVIRGAAVGGGGTGRLRTARVTVGKLNMDPAQMKTFVKVKASYNLKRKILRFRSGSLKLMTTV